MNLENLSSYQNPEGKLRDRLAPRTDIRKGMINWGFISGKSVLDLGCNNGYFTREVMRQGARQAVGVDESNAVVAARELAEKEGVKAEFWQADLDSKEFRRFCPVFDVVLLLSVLTHVRDKEEFLDWLDGHVRSTLVFESNHGEKNKAHIELIQKHMHFENIEYLGPSDVPEKPHYLWICRKWSHEMRYPFLPSLPVEFIPIDKIIGWDEKTILNQKGGYGVESDRFKFLLEDIRKRGIRDPIILQDEKDGYYKGFQGAHRYLAAKQLGYKDVPCKVMRGIVIKHLK